MSKERLEEIKTQLDRFMTPANKPVLFREDAEWIINYAKEQAERVQELEDIIYQDKRQEVIENMYEQNKRYRKAFKQIKLQILFEGAIESHRKNIIEIIDEALEESE